MRDRFKSDPSGQPMAEHASRGAARRRTERRLRFFWSHEQMAIRLAGSRQRSASLLRNIVLRSLLGQWVIQSSSRCLWESSRVRSSSVILKRLHLVWLHWLARVGFHLCLRAVPTSATVAQSCLKVQTTSTFSQGQAMWPPLFDWLRISVANANRLLRLTCEITGAQDLRTFCCLVSL